MRQKISVMINTLNEEENLPMVLDAVQGWVDEIVVVDMHSEDRTREIAETYGARVFLHERLGFADPARAFALAQTSGDWVLMLDADEVVPAALARTLQRLAGNPQLDAVSLPYQNYVAGQALRGLGWGPEQDRHTRFFRRDAMELTGEIHNFLHLRPGARLYQLPYDGSNAVLHFSYTDYASVVAKINRYTDLEAVNKAGKGVRPSVLRALVLPLREFVLTYWVRGGYRDGRLGLHMAVLLAFYKFLREIKLEQRTQLGERQAIQAIYRALAKRAVVGGGEP